jgi:capsular polysaccharide biosynthesis protein
MQMLKLSPIHNGFDIPLEPGFTRIYAPPHYYNRNGPAYPDTEAPRTVSSPSLNIRYLRNIEMIPHHVLVDHDTQQLLKLTFKKHRHHKHGGVGHLGDDRFELRKKNLPATKKIDNPCFYGDTEYPGIYGHDLLEVVSASWAWRVNCKDLKFATSTKDSTYVRTLLNAAGITSENIIFFDTPLLATELLYPDPSIKLRRYAHPVALDLFRKIGDSLFDKELITPERIYISRSRSRGRSLKNELEIEAIFNAYGFTVIHPQELSIEAQVTHFRNAKLIAGTGGSAMHNTVFSRDDARVLILSCDNWYTIIDSLMDQGLSRLGYVFGQALFPTLKRSQCDWQISSKDVHHAIRLHFEINLTI